MATKVWSGFLNFGMLSVPVFLNVAAREKKVELHTYHTACNSQIKSPQYCPKCASMLEKTETYRGYDAGKGKGIVRLESDEMEAITPGSSKVMEISECVKWSDVDPIYLAESFYLLPDDVGKKAYSLLFRALSDSGRVAVVQIAKSSREHMAIIRPKGRGLVLHYLWYDGEVNRVPEFDTLTDADLKANEVKLASQLVESMAADFIPAQYEDGYRQRLNTLIMSKMDRAVQPPAPVNTPARAATVDISAALEASILSQKGKRRITPQGFAPEKPKSKKKVA